MSYFTNISYVLSHLFLILFLYFFIVPRYSKKVTIAICFLSFFTLDITDCLKINFFPNSDLCYVVVTVFQIILTQSTAIFISKKRNVQALFIGLSASSYVIAGSVSAKILWIWTGCDALALVGSFLIHLAILLLLSYKIRKISLRFQEKQYVKNCWELCLIPVFFYCSFSFIAFFPHTLDEYPANITGIIFFIITMFVAYIVVLQYMESETKKTAIYWEKMLLESYIKGLENQHYLVERAEQNLKILHHDMRHYCKIMDSLLDQERYVEIRKVIEHINNVSDENRVKKYSNNLIVNTILVNMMEKAQANGIDVNLDVNVSRAVPVNEYEFTLVIANLFENALDYVKKLEEGERHIDIKIHCTGDHLFIQTKNECRDEIRPDSVTGLPQSTKKGNHGWGMQSALAFSEKIGGTIGCYTENNIFQIIIYAKF